MTGAEGRCPICGRPSEPKARPFCSARCADVDLGRWLTGAYALPVEAEEDEDGQAPPRDDPGQARDPSL
ncbi:MAG: DNA gyrase inhibitor YacG [Methylobacteriaceae bacterium]|nr:DNA gyrase inhibitor YacG [Methylobacteriaceae bacterium]